MAITLAAVPTGNILMQALVLLIVGVAITVAVYGAVAFIVKADDVGVALAQNRQTSTIGGTGRVLGRTLVRGMPVFLTCLSAVGTAAMVWVGGGIVLHGVEKYGPPSVSLVVHAAAEVAGQVLPFPPWMLEWAVAAIVSGAVGLMIGAAAIPVFGYVIGPGWKLVKGVLASMRT